MSNHHLVVENLSKSFGLLKANDNVTIHVQRGSVHAILGENGAGKTTLMNMLYGLLQPDSGRILLDGKPVRIDSPRRALDLGIGMVHQHFMLVGPLTVTENVILGMDQGGRLDLATHERRLRELSDSFGFEVEPRQITSRLPIGMQQRVEILKCLYRNAELIILDEPTSVLTPGEAESFFQVLRRLQAAGKTIIFITHKLEEVMALSDRVTVMRAGAVTNELATRDTNTNELARLMVGRDILFQLEGRKAQEDRPVLLEVKDLAAAGDRGNRAVDGLNFQLKEGEILGIAGVDGNGQAEFAEAITGLRSYDAGSIRLKGEELAPYSIADRIHKLRIGYVPEDRHRTGLVLDQSVASNLMLRAYNRAPFVQKSSILDFGAIRENAKRLVERYRVRASSVDQHVRRLSGGNQQKVILAREIEAEPRLLVVAQPCKGLDVGAIEFVQNTLIEQRNKGVGIIYISTELEHILAICDRIAVMFRGRITGFLRPEEATSERIGRLMAGVTEDAA